MSPAAHTVARRFAPEATVPPSGSCEHHWPPPDIGASQADCTNHKMWWSVGRCGVLAHRLVPGGQTPLGSSVNDGLAMTAPRKRDTLRKATLDDPTSPNAAT
jgi:hypothetical protein